MGIFWRLQLLFLFGLLIRSAFVLGTEETSEVFDKLRRSVGRQNEH